MIISFAIGAAVLLIIGEFFIVAAAGTFRRGLQLPDFVALIMPPVALVSMVVSFLFLNWAAALFLTIALLVVIIWTAVALLKLPVRKQFR